MSTALPYQRLLDNHDVKSIVTLLLSVEFTTVQASVLISVCAESAALQMKEIGLHYLLRQRRFVEALHFYNGNCNVEGFKDAVKNVVDGLLDILTPFEKQAFEGTAILT